MAVIKGRSYIEGICDLYKLSFFLKQSDCFLFYKCSCLFDLYFKDFIGCVILHTRNR